MNCAGAKLLSLTRIERLPPVGQRRPEVHALDVVERDAEHVEVEQQRLLRRLEAAQDRREALDTVDVVRFRHRDGVELDRVAGSGDTDGERALHREQRLRVERQQLDETADREGSRRHRRLGDRVGAVDVLPVERAAEPEVVAQKARRAARGDGSGRAVLDERALGAREDPAALRRRRGALEAEVQPDTAGPGRVRAERVRHGEVAQLAALEAELAHPGVDQPVREALRRDHERPAARERESLRVEALRRERLPGGVGERRHVDDLHGRRASAVTPIRSV